jgi:hypothetical protein
MILDWGGTLLEPIDGSQHVHSQLFLAVPRRAGRHIHLIKVVDRRHISFHPASLNLTTRGPAATVFGLAGH